LERISKDERLADDARFLNEALAASPWPIPWEKLDGDEAADHRIVGARHAAMAPAR